MSTIIMGLCWPLQMQPTSKAVLMALADQANDQAVCWPGIPSIMKRTCYGRTAVIEALKWLEANKLIEVDRSASRSNRYTLTPDAFEGDRSGDFHYVYCITHKPTGAFYIGLRSSMRAPDVDDYWGSGKACEWLDSVRHECERSVVSIHENREEAAQRETDLLAEYISDGRCLNRRVSSPKQAMGNAPSLFSAPAGPSASRTVRRANHPVAEQSSPPAEPSTVRQADQPVRQADPNRKEPSVKRKENTPPLVAVTDLVADGLTEQTAVEWLAHRKRKRAPLTPRAWEGIKAEAVKAGWPIEQAIVKAMARGWQSFDADFVAKEPLPEEAHQAKWWERAPGIRQKGIELGVGDWDREAWESGRGGQDWPTYSGRVFRAAGPGPWQKREAAPLGAGLLKAVA